MIRCIAAVDNRLGVADDHGIPWQGLLPKDVQYYRDKIRGHTVLMGYGEYLERPHPIPKTRNVVASRRSTSLRPGFELVHDANEFLAKTKEDVWVSGGANLFASILDKADELYLTRLDKDFHCTKFFPDFDGKFTLKSRSEPQSENGINYVFEVWQHAKT